MTPARPSTAQTVRTRTVGLPVTLYPGDSRHVLMHAPGVEYPILARCITSDCSAWSILLENMS